MTTSDWTALALFFIALISIIGLAEIIRRLMRWSPEATRKLVHMLVGVLVATTPFVLNSMWPMIILGMSFALIDFIAVRHNFFRSMHGTRRPTYGTVFYPISFVILTACLWDHDKLVLIGSMLIMALADAGAAVVGESVKKPRIFILGEEKKSFQGSAAMFVISSGIILSSLLVARSMGFVDLSTGRILFVAMLVGIVATIAEMLSAHGSDNLSVPLGSAFVFYFLLHESVHAGLILAFGMALAFAIALLSYRLRFLSGSGSAALVLLGTLVFGVGGWSFAGPILAFFILSSLLSRMGKKRKQRLLNVFEKSGTRDAGQVLANGGVAGLLLVVWYFSKAEFYYLAYLASLAAVTADTWGTEIGVMAKRAPRSILTLKRVPMGTSGGVTIVGTMGAVAGAAILAMTGLVFGGADFSSLHQPSVLVIIITVGVLASLVDSLLGATVQAQFKCPVCTKITEKQIHCGAQKTDFHRGIAWINNDVVNSLCAMSSVLIIWLLMQFQG